MSTPPTSGAEKTIVSLVSSPSLVSSVSGPSIQSSALTSNAFPLPQPQKYDSQKIIKHYQKKRRRLEIAILELRNRYKSLKRKQKEIESAAVPKSTLTRHKEEARDRASALGTQKIANVASDYAAERQNVFRLRNELDLLTFQITEERRIRAEIADISDEVKFEIFEPEFKKSEEKEGVFTKYERNRIYNDISDLNFNVEHLQNTLLSGAVPYTNTDAFMKAAKEISDEANAQIKLYSIVNMPHAKESEILKERVKETERSLKNVEKEIREIREKSTKAAGSRRTELAEKNERNNIAEDNWSNEIEAIEKQRAGLINAIEETAQNYDKISYEISEIKEKFNEMQINIINSQSMDYLYDDSDEEEENEEKETQEKETLDFLIKKRNQIASELEEIKKEKRNLKESLDRRERNLKTDIRKKIDRLKTVKQMILGEIPFDSSSESSSLMSLDMMSFIQ